MKGNSKKLGLFIGAGTSYELGMPLVWDLTFELKRWLTPEKLRMFNQTWLRNGTGFSSEVIDDFIKVLGMPGLHYESILGHLETQFIKNGPHRKDYHGLYSWLVEAVYAILLERHLRNVGYIQKNIRFYEGIKALVPNDGPLWVFSLNHDLIMECLSAHYGIQLSAGFSTETTMLPRRNSRGEKIGELKGEIFRGDLLEKSAMQFLDHQTPGINLLKVHGSLDVFTFQDGKDLLRILPNENSIVAWIECLRSVNEELIYIEPKAPGGRIKTTNEISYADETGEMQFLRRSILSGAYKFDHRMSQTLPKKLLDHFKSNLNYVSTLVCAGYGFGDNHVDQVIKDWLSFSSERRLEIIDPYRKEVPPSLLHLSPQICFKNLVFTDYLDTAAGITRTRRELLEKKLGAWARKNQFDETKKNEFADFIKKSLDARLHTLVQDIAGLPIKNGDIDVRSLGLTPDELIKDVLDKNKMNMDDMLEAFLKSHS